MSENVVHLRPWLLRGAIGGICDICQRESGNVAHHRPACARRHGRLPLGPGVSLAEEELVVRAGVHAAPRHKLQPEERFQQGVTDLDVARLVHQVERGTVVYPSPSWRTWRTNVQLPYMRRALTTVVNEAMRLGVLRPETAPVGLAVYRTMLVAEKTHAQMVGCVNKPACAEYSEKPKRWRLLKRDQLAYVDCQTCMDQPLSAVQY